MRMTCDVLIIGGGIIGVCAAYYCATAGASVMLIEQSSICAGCSNGNAGLIVPSYSIPLPSPGIPRKALWWLLNPYSPFYVRARADLSLLRWLGLFVQNCRIQAVRNAIPVIRDLAACSIRLYEEILASQDVPCNYEHKGALELYVTASGLREGRAKAALLREFGIHSSEMTASAACELVPAACARTVAGTYYPGDSHLVPADFVRGLAKKVEKLGARVFSGTRVDSLRIAGDTVSAAVTSAGEILASEVVIATGAWSSQLLGQLDLCLPLQPAKGYSVTLPASPPLKVEIPLLLHEAKLAVTPMGDFIRFAGALELAGFNLSINPRRTRRLLQDSRDYLSGIKTPSSVEAWTGLRPCTPDGLPVIGRFKKFKNLVVATGHGMLGVTLGPVTGKIVSEMLFEKASAFDLAPLSPMRFA